MDGRGNSEEKYHDDEGGDRQSIGGKRGESIDGEGVDGESSQAPRDDVKAGADGIGCDRGIAASECQEIPSEREKLERVTFFLSPAVIAWLKFWSKKHGMRSPSKFLNTLLEKIMKENG